MLYLTGSPLRNATRINTILQANIFLANIRLIIYKLSYNSKCTPYDDILFTRLNEKKNLNRLLVAHSPITIFPFGHKTLPLFVRFWEYYNSNCDTFFCVYSLQNCFVILSYKWEVHMFFPCLATLFELKEIQPGTGEAIDFSVTCG